MLKLPHMRTGDRVVARGIVVDGYVELIPGTFIVEVPNLCIGDPVSWEIGTGDGRERVHGRVVGSYRDPEIDTVWVWIRLRDRAGHAVFLDAELRREPEPADDPQNRRAAP